MEPAGSVVVLMLVALAGAVNANFQMLPCSPRQAIAGTILGCAIGLLAAVPSIQVRTQPSLTRRVLMGIGFWLALTAFILALHLVRSRLPVLPDWADPIGEFFTGGMYLTLFLAPFTLGMCILFHAKGRSAGRSEHAGSRQGEPGLTPR
jgi:hypothetical protein